MEVEARNPRVWPLLNIMVRAQRHLNWLKMAFLIGNISTTLVLYRPKPSKIRTARQ
ncbi:hypothetical protein N431DRAFT_431750 [Stipitochalara longipes BDJ]|nr:hypothetical protein N431DRAFT_431750 [Stipitochalara longipes BDJ]